MVVLAVWKEAALGWPTHGYLWPVTLCCTEVLFLMKYPQKWIQSNSGAELVLFELAASQAHAGDDSAAWRILFNPSTCCGVRNYVAGEESCRYVCKPTLGHPEVACKKICSGFWKQKVHLFCERKHSSVQSMGKIHCWWRDLEDREWLLACLLWLYLKYISSYCKADKILRGFLYLKPQMSRLNIT